VSDGGDIHAVFRQRCFNPSLCGMPKQRAGTK
jgi:hypothetical protein